MTRLQDLLKQLPRLQIKFPQALTEFTLFPKLPVELRRTIWGIAAMEPRYIKVFILEARRRDSRIDGQVRSDPDFIMLDADCWNLVNSACDHEHEPRGEI